jgi:hypothetical protein
MTGYDEEAAHVNRARSAWWHKWSFLAVALITALITAGLLKWLVK